MYITNTTGTKEIFVNITETNLPRYELYSYGTHIATAIVCKITKSMQIRCTGLYSATTRRHISDFAKLITLTEKVSVTFNDFKNAVGKEKVIIKY